MARGHIVDSKAIYAPYTSKHAKSTFQPYYQISTCTYGGAVETSFKCQQQQEPQLEAIAITRYN